MQVAGALAEAGGEALRQHLQQAIELRARQRRIRPRPPHQREQVVLVPLARRNLGHDLLRQHVARRRRHDQRVQLAAAHRIQQRRAFHQLVAGRGEQPPLGHAADLVAGAPHPLQEGGDAARRADLADQVDIADVNAQLQRGGRHQHLQFPTLEPLLGIQPQLLGQRPVVCGHVLLTQQLAEVAGSALRHPAGIDEDQGGRVLLHQFGDARVHQLPLRVRHHRFQRYRRQFQRKIALARVADIDDGARKGVRFTFHRS